jgi:uncharacterized protein YdcH (DUF465 family)
MKSVSSQQPSRRSDEARLHHAEARHRELDQRIASFGGRYLTPDEERAVTDLKKRKLALKDELSRLKSR